MQKLKLFIFELEKYLGIALILTLTFFAKTLWQPSVVFGATEENANATETMKEKPFIQTVVTKSSFNEKTEEQTEIIPRKTVYQDDPETEAGDDKILDEGEDGSIKKVFKVTLYHGKEYSRELVSEVTAPTKDKKISRGTKIVWKTIQTADGEIRYWKKMRVYATHYDSDCPGCDMVTATGMRQGKGVIAVDPKVIKLRSKVYVPGYGTAVAGDTGGAIKGNIIDLGFEDAKTAGWHAQYVDIYLL